MKSLTLKIHNLTFNIIPVIPTSTSLPHAFLVTSTTAKIKSCTALFFVSSRRTELSIFNPGPRLVTDNGFARKIHQGDESIGFHLLQEPYETRS